MPTLFIHIVLLSIGRRLPDFGQIMENVAYHKYAVALYVIELLCQEQFLPLSKRQAQRFAGTTLYSNADMGPGEMRQFCDLDDTGRRLMKSAMSQMNLSARGFHRVLKVGRTIADLAGCEQIGPAHLAEALQYRARGQ